MVLESGFELLSLVKVFLQNPIHVAEKRMLWVDLSDLCSICGTVTLLLFLALQPSTQLEATWASAGLSCGLR